MTVLGEEAENPGDRRAVSLESRAVNKMGRIQGSVEAVTVLDIMEKIQAPSYIIKTDIQKYDCKVRFSVIFITSINGSSCFLPRTDKRGPRS